ncbi:MAG: 3-hydroxyacyl-CoA dehydrogenase NAD-binding domain-containing protein [Chitinophagales bacterium]
MKTIAVLGAGKMGAGIAQAAAEGGYFVIMRDLQASIVERGLQQIDRSLTNKIDAEISIAQKNEIMERIHGVTDLSEIRRVDMVIESIIENISVKTQVFAELDHLCTEDAILATNTSSLSISAIASATKRADRVIGMHFFNPVPATKLVEIIKGLETSDDTVVKTLKLTGDMGKEGILLQRESPGFIVNRLLVPAINEAIWAYAEGVAGKEDIDKAMKLGAGMPEGPLRLADSIGLDTLYSVLLVMYEEFRDPKFRPHPLFSTMVRAGYLGRKTGRGFYEY